MKDLKSKGRKIKMSNNNIADLVNAKTSVAQKAEADTKQRFMLVLEDSVREDLRSLCDELGVKQIGFASELFTTALNDAKQALVNQKRAKAAEAKAEGSASPTAKK